MNEKLIEALNGIRDKHIQEAAKPGRIPKRWLGAIAAVLALVILLTSFHPVTAHAVALADYSEATRADYQAVMDSVSTLSPFFAESITRVLSGSNGENAAFSPINLYMAMSAVAELTGGDPQIMEALNARDLNSLRKQTNNIWNHTYRDKGNQCLLANSLWLDKDLRYDQTTMDILARDHYTSVYQGDFGTRRTNRDIANWLNGKTENLLKDSTDGINLDPETVFALYATIYYQAKWADEFNAIHNTKAPFHAPGGDVTCTYMNKQRISGEYYWGTDFGAITLNLKDGARMWLILPDEDKTVEDVLSAGEYAEMVFEGWKNSKYMYINLSLPKFDVRSGGDLKEDLQSMGITHIFEPGMADFSTLMPEYDGPIWLSAVNQATRVAIDEKGVTAASYIEIPGVGNAAPPTEVIDFVLDRPFIFVITTSTRLPLFAGVVNAP